MLGRTKEQLHVGEVYHPEMDGFAILQMVGKYLLVFS